MKKVLRSRTNLALPLPPPTMPFGLWVLLAALAAVMTMGILDAPAGWLP